MAIRALFTNNVAAIQSQLLNGNARAKEQTLKAGVEKAKALVPVLTGQLQSQIGRSRDGVGIAPGPAERYAAVVNARTHFMDEAAREMARVHVGNVIKEAGRRRFL